MRLGTYQVFRAETLGIFFLCYFLLAVITAGMSVPSGLVIPMLIMGGAMGRLGKKKKKEKEKNRKEKKERK